MKVFTIIITMFLLVCLTVPAICANNQFRLGAGAGVPYGGVGGVSAEYYINNYISVGAGLGNRGSYDGPGWSLGARFYPLKSNNTWNPRLTGYYGRLGTVNWSNGNHEGYNGGALGGGLEWRVYKMLSLDLDILYLAKDLPAHVKSSNDVGVSAGIGIVF